MILAYRIKDMADAMVTRVKLLEDPPPEFELGPLSRVPTVQWKWRIPRKYEEYGPDLYVDIVSAARETEPASRKQWVSDQAFSVLVSRQLADRNDHEELSEFFEDAEIIASGLADLERKMPVVYTADGASGTDLLVPTGVSTDPLVDFELLHEFGIANAGIAIAFAA